MGKLLHIRATVTEVADVSARYWRRARASLPLDVREVELYYGIDARAPPDSVLIERVLSLFYRWVSCELTICPKTLTLKHLVLRTNRFGHRNVDIASQKLFGIIFGRRDSYMRSESVSVPQLVDVLLWGVHFWPFEVNPFAEIENDF